jgi:hypothetical protein
MVNLEPLRGRAAPAARMNRIAPPARAAPATGLLACNGFQRVGCAQPMLPIEKFIKPVRLWFQQFRSRLNRWLDCFRIQPTRLHQEIGPTGEPMPTITPPDAASPSSFLASCITLSFDFATLLRRGKSALGCSGWRYFMIIPLLAFLLASTKLAEKRRRLATPDERGGRI